MRRPATLADRHRRRRAAVAGLQGDEERPPRVGQRRRPLRAQRAVHGRVGAAVAGAQHREQRVEVGAQRGGDHVRAAPRSRAGRRPCRGRRRWPAAASETRPGSGPAPRARRRPWPRAARPGCGARRRESRAGTRCRCRPARRARLASMISSCARSTAVTAEAADCSRVQRHDAPCSTRRPAFRRCASTASSTSDSVGRGEEQLVGEHPRTRARARRRSRAAPRRPAAAAAPPSSRRRPAPRARSESGARRSCARRRCTSIARSRQCTRASASSARTPDHLVQRVAQLPGRQRGDEQRPAGARHRRAGARRPRRHGQPARARRPRRRARGPRRGAGRRTCRSSCARGLRSGR